MKTFGTQGPVAPEKNYIVQRSDEIAEIVKRIKRRHYIVLHAPQKTGKTTLFRLVMDALAVEEPTYFMIQLNFENRENLSKEDFYGDLRKDLCEEIKKVFQKRGDVPSEALSDFLENAEITDNISMRFFYKDFEKLLTNEQLVLFIEKFHGIPETIENGFLASLRSIYNSRYKRCPHSVVFESLEWFIQRDMLSAVSPFNIQDDYALPNFSMEQVQELLGQYTAEVGQTFAPEVIAALHERTDGQPFLVNQVARILTEELEIPKSEVITMEHFSKAEIKV